jgi:hypothetical protein
MILRSLTKHVKDQNWFAVGLDFAIVVIGVFIGIQVANWNELQGERAQTERMLSELVMDLKEMREDTTRQSALFLGRASAANRILNLLEETDGAELELAPADVIEVLRVNVPARPPAGLNEVLVAGRLDLIGRVHLREALRRFSKVAEAHQTGFKGITEGYWPARAVIKRYVSIGRTPNADGDTFYGTAADIDVDLDGLRSSANARGELESLYVFHVNSYELSQHTMDSIDAVFAAAPDLVEN